MAKKYARTRRRGRPCGKSRRRKRMMRGGSFKSFLKSANKFLKKHKILSTASSVFGMTGLPGSQIAKSGTPLLRSLGYGLRRSGGGLRRAGGRYGKGLRRAGGAHGSRRRMIMGRRLY